MYSHCIYCSAPLGANHALEQFPVGRTLAFDAEKGRLWAVCPKCARWNLAPIEERWEAVEAAEQRFRDTRLRAQNENVGVAKLPDGTRLIRVGRALPGEIAAWRYGEGLVARRRRVMLQLGGASALVLGAIGWKVALVGVFGLVGVSVQLVGQAAIHMAMRQDLEIPIHRFRPGSLPYGDAFTLTAREMRGSRLVPADEGGFDLRVPHARTAVRPGDDGKPAHIRFSGFMLCGEDARNALGRTIAVANVRGGSRRSVQAALRMLSDARDVESFLRGSAEREARVEGDGRSRDERRVHRLAVEIALHAAQERRALEGELTLLAAAWKEAEALAAIADRLAVSASPAEATT